MTPSRIDVHAHFLPPDYVQALNKYGHAMPDGMPSIPPWSVEEHLGMMEDIGISKSILSISSPGTHLVPGNDTFAAELTRYTNKFAAGVKEAHPDKFGYFASMPLPAIDLTLTELATAFDEGADGVIALTNFHGRYLGDPFLEPIMKELDSRHATIMIHPTTPLMIYTDPVTGEEKVLKATPLSYPNPVYEFFHDTVRALTNLLLTGTMSRFSNITWIVPHAGGAFPPIFSRISGFTQVVDIGLVVTEDSIRELLLKRCFFDLAGWVFPANPQGKGQLAGLIDGIGIPETNLLIGTDYCWTPAPAAKRLQGVLDEQIGKWFDEKALDAIYRENAERLLSKENTTDSSNKK